MKFFIMFGQMTQHILDASEILGEMIKNPSGDLQQLAGRIKDLEHKGTKPPIM